MPGPGQPMGILQRSSTVLHLLAERGPLTTAKVAELVGMPRPSVYRLADALTQARLVEPADDGRLRVSLRWLRLSAAARQGMTEWSGAREILDDLASTTGQTAYLSVPHGAGTVCIDWSPGGRVSVLALRPGRMLPLHVGAEGRVTLAFRQEDPEGYLRSAPFPTMTNRTLITAAQLRADVEATRERGYSVSDEDVTPGIGALGVPVRSADGLFTGALSLAGLAEDVRERRLELATRLLASAGQLAANAERSAS